MWECSLNIFLCCLHFSRPNYNHLILFFSLCISLTHYFSQSFDTCRDFEQIPETLCPSFLLTENPHASTHRLFSAHCMHGQSDVTKSALQAIKRLFITVSDLHILFLLSDNGLEVCMQRRQCGAVERMLCFRKCLGNDFAWKCLECWNVAVDVDVRRSVVPTSFWVLLMGRSVLISSLLHVCKVESALHSPETDSSGQDTI